MGPVLLAALVSAASMLPGCRDREGPRKGRKKRPVEIERLPGDLNQVHNALMLDQAALFRAFDAFRLNARSELRARMGSGSWEELKETYLLERDGSGRLHGCHHNSKERGFEFFWEKDVFHFRNRYMPWQQRPSKEGERDEVVSRIWGVLSAYWELMEPHVRLEGAKPKEFMGRPVHVYHILKRKKARFSEGEASSRTADPDRRWRRSVKVEKVHGTVLLDKVTALPIQVAVDLTYTFERDGGLGLVHLKHRHELAVQKPSFAIEKPRSIPAPIRLRPELERQALLGHLRAPGWYRGGGPVKAHQKRSRKRASREETTPRLRRRGSPAVRNR